MVYDWTKIGIKEITSLYLYRQVDVPANLADESLIRPKDVKGGQRYGADILVDTLGFMSTGPGRFALGSMSSMVGEFFSSDISDDFFVKGREYTKEEMRDLITSAGFASKIKNDKGDYSYGINLAQVDLADGVDDYFQRAFVWNSGAFKLADSVRFIVSSDGTRYIKDYAIVPNETVQENFDFVGSGIIAGVSNSMNAGLIDPSGIGRQVKINFTGDVTPKKEYLLADFVSDSQKHALHQGKGLLALATLPQEEVSLIENLWGSGATRTLIDGKAIIFGSDKADNLDISKLQQSYAVTGPLSPFFDGNYLRSYY
ncbi:MAG: hypothetical protein ACYC3N_11220, partial [Halothiobacillus sp.]